MKRLLLVLCSIGLLASLSVAHAATPPNLIQNGTLETGTTGAPAHWASYAWGTGTSTMTYPITGLNGRGVQITVTSAGSGFGRSFTPTATIPTTGGKTYVYTDNTKCSTRTMDLDVAYTHAGGNVEYVGLVAHSVANNTWVNNMRTFTVPVGVTSFVVYRATATVGSCIIDNVFLSEPTTPPTTLDPLVSFTFDDGYLQAPAINVLAKYKAQGTFYLNSGPIKKGWSGYLTPGQVRTVALQGNEIGGHTINHPDLTTLTDAQVHTEVANDKVALQTMSGVPVVSFAYPYGEYNARVQNLVASTGMTNARGVESGLNPVPIDTFGMQATCLEKTNTLAQAKAMVDAAVQGKGWMQFCFHGITNAPGQYDWTPANLEALIQYVMASPAKIVTVTEGVNLRK